MTNEIWTAACDSLVQEIGKDNFRNWIQPLEFLGVDELRGVTRFSVASSFARSWVEQNYSAKICDALRAAGLNTHRLELSIDPKLSSSSNASSAETSARARDTAKVPGINELSDTALEKRFTFDQFVVGKPNELAYTAARRVAQGGPVTINPLTLYGGVGLGKTHLMHAIAWEIKARNPNTQVLLLSAEQFMYRFVQALRERTMMDFKQLFRAVDLLMIDDLQFIAGKDSTQEEFFHTFNALVGQGKQIIASADRSPGDIEGLEPRIASRLMSGLVVDLLPTSFELRLGILQSKSEFYAKQFRGATLCEGVLEFLAAKITSNVRVLDGAIMRVYAYGDFIKKPLDLTLVRECLSDLLRQVEKKVTIDEIQRTVCAHYNIRIADLIGPQRLRTYVRPRQVAMYLCKEMTQRSLPEIGRHFGKRDHSTVLHAIKRIDELARTDAQIAEDLTLLRVSLQSTQ